MDHSHQEHNHDYTPPGAHDEHASMHHGGHEGHDKHAGHDPNMFKQKFWLSLLFTIPTLVFSHTVQSWFGLNWMFTGSEYIPAVFGTIIFFYGGLVFLKSAKAELADKQPGMMTLISMAITVAFGYSLAVTLNLVDGMDFWWELATLVTIMLLGHWLEMASVMNAQGALNELAKLLPDEAELVTNGETKKVPVAELKIGDTVLVRPGAQVPADGEVIKGESDVNESMLTGESKPVKKTVGAAVIGGTIVGSGSLTIRITRTGSDTALAGIMKLVSEAQSSKSKTQILADKAAFYLTFVALGAALVTWIAWAIAGESSGFILERIVTVLVIACPHALGLAVPLVTAISTTLAAKNGLLVRQRMALEAARNVDVVLFDKTGTLTKGEQGVVDIVSEGDKNELLTLAAAVEAESEHPIARAIVTSAKDQSLSVPQATDFSALSGRGAKANVSGRTIYVGGPRMIEELQAALPTAIKEASGRASSEGKTVVYVIEDKKVRGAIMLADVIREESKEAVATLQGMGKRVAMLTGDAEGVAAWVSKELGITEYFAEVLPEHKADTVKKLQADGSRVAMVGDGVNDAPALTQADIGIAIGAGTDVAIESAGIVLASSDPRGVAKIVKLSRSTYRKMQQNLWWATGYNALAIPLAAGATAAFGFVLSPAFGAVLMSLSTIIVAVNAQFLRKLRLQEGTAHDNDTPRQEHDHQSHDHREHSHNHEKHDAEHHHHHDTSAAAEIPVERQVTCIVTGDVFDKQVAEAAGHVSEYKGKKYYFCCGTCVQLFNKNPEKYATHHNLAMGLNLIEKENLVDNVWAFRFEPTTEMTWTAGQFIRIELPHDKPDVEGTKRWFTISSAPYEGIVQITTRVTQSTFKRALANLPVGDRLPLLEKPDGDFIWENSDKPLVFIAGGIGITPFRSILRQRVHEGVPLNITLVYGNRTDAIVFQDEFDSYAQQDQEFKVQYVTGEPLTAAKLAELVPNLSSSLVYLSGPEPMVESLGDQLKTAGLPEAQLKQDFFPNYNDSNY